MKYLSTLLFLLLAGCVSAPSVDRAAADLEAGARAVPGDADYHVLMAEIALQRNETDVAVAEYLAGALASDDPEVAARATRVAYTYGATEQGLGAARRWAALAPDAGEPREFLVRLYLRAGDGEGALAHLSVLYDRSEAGPRRFLALLPVLAEAQDRPETLEAVEALAGRHPDDASGWYSVAALALRTGDAGKAAEASGRAVELDPAWGEAAALHARSMAAAGRTDEALAWLEARPDADSPMMRLERGILLLSADRVEEARVQLEAVLAADPGNAGALRALGYADYYAGDFESARRRFTALMATGRFTDDALFYLGSIAEQQGDIEEAVRLYSRVSGGENWVTAQVRLALVMFRLGHPQVAIDHLEEFARLNPGAEVELSSARAELWMRMDEPDKALAVYDEIIERNPDSDDALYSRALLYERLDRVDDAVADFQRILERRPDDPTALNALGFTLADRTDRHEEALRLIERAYAQVPDSPAIIDSMGWVLFRLGRPEEAVDYLRRAWEIERDPEIAAHLGEVLWSLDRRDEARDVWTDAIVDFPDSDVLRETMGRLDP